MVNLVPKTYTSRLKDFIGRRTTPTGLTPDDGIRYWQERLLLVFIFIGTVLGLFVYLPSVALSIKEGLWSVAVADTIIYAWIVILFFRRSIPFAVRAVTVSLISYILGMVLLLTIGPFGGGPVWLFAFPVMVAILLGLRISLMALAVNAGTLIIIGILLQFSIMQWDYSATNPVEKWLVISLNFLLLNSIVTISIALISGGIQGLLKRQKSMLASLEKSEEKFRVLFEFAPDAYYLNDFQGTFIDGNRTAEELLGYKKEALIGKNFLELNLLSPDQLPKALELLGKNLEGKETGPDEFILNPKSGEPVVVEIRTLPTEIDGQNIILGIARDVSKRKQLETSLHRAQKMEAMGLLAGGVAHDLNNILSGIVSYPELLLMDLPEDSPLRKPIKTIQESGMRAADVVDDLLTIARGVATGKEALNLNTIVTEYLESPEYQELDKTHSFVNFETELDPDLLNMTGSPVHTNKTLMNLVVNASEAIEGAGTVTISSMNRYLDEPLKGYEDVHTGEYAVLSVSDDGSGIAPKDLEKIFEPFYTKKVMGRSGTGLGLAIVWNTVQDHNGYINVESSEKGTVFYLYFPVTRKDVANEKEKIPLETYLGHGEKILVVDDEERQREIACGILTKLGYNPEAVSSGEEAVEYVKENAVDLIVLDMVMPKGINGRETYQQITKIRPGQKAVIASGYAKTKEVDIAQELGAGKYIKKPYILEKIGIAVKEELEK